MQDSVLETLVSLVKMGEAEFYDIKVTIELTRSKETPKPASATTNAHSGDSALNQNKPSHFSKEELAERFPKEASALSQVYFLINAAGRPLYVREMKNMLHEIGYEISHLDQRCSQFRDQTRLIVIPDVEDGKRGRYDIPDRFK